MFFRRTLDQGTLVHQKRDASGTWQPLDASPLGPSPFSEAYETEVAGRHPQASVLPFQPLSFRPLLFQPLSLRFLSYLPVRMTT